MISTAETSLANVIANDDQTSQRADTLAAHVTASSTSTSIGIESHPEIESADTPTNTPIDARDHCNEGLCKQLARAVSIILMLLWLVLSVLMILSWINVLPITQLDVYREYEATGEGCITLGVWYEIVVAAPWISMPALFISMVKRSKFEKAIPLCLCLCLADLFHTKLHITGHFIDVVVTMCCYLLAFSNFLYIYSQRPVEYISKVLKLLLFILFSGVLYCTLGTAAYFSFCLLCMLVTAVHNEQFKLKYSICSLVLLPLINMLVYFEAVHCIDIRNVLGFDGHVLTDFCAQYIVLLGIIIVWDLPKNKTLS